MYELNISHFIHFKLAPAGNFSKWKDIMGCVLSMYSRRIISGSSKILTPMNNLQTIYETFHKFSPPHGFQPGWAPAANPGPTDLLHISP